ncbi:hypothetical protein [Primorskyibacter sedentarius]|uniref:hypothetical protein n=1 Tax=Primorskyibacter sedentarius TaxID=745311 RepID=UPI003EBFD1B2
MTRQIELNFEGGLINQFPNFRECVHASVYNSGKQLKAVAADLDYSPSKLSRMLADNPDDPLNFPIDRFPELVAATGDLRPIFWLVERFLEDSDAKRKRAADQLMSMLPQIQAALTTLQQQEGGE